MTNNIVVAGMHRTGHHPIAVWLLHQQEGIHDFSIQTIAPWLFQIQNDQGVSILANNPLKRGPEEHPDKEKFDDIMQGMNPHRIILTHEQEKLSQVAFACAHSGSVWSEDNVVQNTHRWSTIHKPRIVVVLRDFKNWLASCIKMAQRDNKEIKDIINEDKVEVYKDHFRYINDTNAGIQYILYNEWVESPKYRKEICSNLGLYYTDSAINQLSPFGGGSSFDGMKHIKTAWEMTTTKRYKYMEDNPFYKTFLHQHNDALLLSDEVFGKYT